MKPKTWSCEHIDRALDDANGFLLKRQFVGDCGSSTFFIDDSWQFCPICGAKRPTKQPRKRGKG